MALGAPTTLIDLESLNGMRSMYYRCRERGLILKTVAKKKSLKERTLGRAVSGYTTTGAENDLFSDPGRARAFDHGHALRLRQENRYALEAHECLLYGTRRRYGLDPSSSRSSSLVAGRP